MKKYFLNKMSTGKRLAKRSIIGMRVCALAEDGLYYPGRIHAVKTPASPKDNQNCINLTPNTRYSVRFDPNPVFGQQRRGIYEFSCSELIGDGFGSINDVKLKPGQKVYITHNGRETGGSVVEHDIQMDEVTIQIQAAANEVSVIFSNRCRCHRRRCRRLEISSFRFACSLEWRELMFEQKSFKSSTSTETLLRRIKKKKAKYGKFLVVVVFP